MTYSKDEEWFKQLIEDGIQTLDQTPLESKPPPIHPYWMPIWEAFMVLSRSRPVGFGLGAIQIVEVKSYLELFPYHDVQEFLICIRELDSAYLKWQDDHPKKN